MDASLDAVKERLLELKTGLIDIGRRAARVCGRTVCSPTERTRPELVRDYVSDLYKYEIRRLRDRYVRREFSKADYAAEGRRPSPPVSGAGLRARDWVE